MTCNYELSIQKVVDVIKALNLPGIGTNVFAQDIGDDAKDFTAFPGVTVFPYGVETIGTGPDTPAGRVDIGYPVVVWILDNKSAGAATRDTRLTWRRQMQDALLLKQWADAGFTGQFNTLIEPGPVTDNGVWFNAQKFGSMFTVRVFWREVAV